MIAHTSTIWSRCAASVRKRVPGMFNLNDPQWGRGDEGEGQASASSPSQPPAPQPPAPQPAPQGEQQPNPNPSPKRPNRGQQPPGPPDLDELWRDVNQKINGWFGGKKSKTQRSPQQGGNHGNGGEPGGLPRSAKGAGMGVGVIAGVAALIWLVTGFFVVREGQQAVITHFGKFDSTAGVGLNWHLPYPIEAHETIPISQLRSVEVGGNAVVQNTGLRNSSMLTQDENIVDVRFVVQYRVKSASDFLFKTVDPKLAVVQAAESAVREVVGKADMNTVLNEKREAIAGDIVKSIQSQLDLYQTGVAIASVNIQNVQPPEQVQAAFDDALKASQDGDRAKNEGRGYANVVIPGAQGTASRLKEEAEGYKSTVIARAMGDTERFNTILTEYRKSPQVTRNRMQTDAMQQIYSNTTKVMVDSKSTGLLQLPLDKILAQTAAAATTATAAATPSTPPPTTPASPATTDGNSAPSATGTAPAAAQTNNDRSRDNGRSRDRDGR